MRKIIVGGRGGEYRRPFLVRVGLVRLRERLRPAEPPKCHRSEDRGAGTLEGIEAPLLGQFLGPAEDTRRLALLPPACVHAEYLNGQVALRSVESAFRFAVLEEVHQQLLLFRVGWSLS